MAQSPGVYQSKKKNGDIYYRVSLTYRRKHISLGSFEDYDTASQVYMEGRHILEHEEITLTDYCQYHFIEHGKFVCLLNFRDTGLYFPNPIYLRKQYFEYYLTQKQVLKFDRDDLFFYASHRIQQKGGYLFVSDYGSQYKLLNRYGIKPFAVYGRDYVMINGDKNDYRYSNIRVINNYIGVQKESLGNGKIQYLVKIHVRGDYRVGIYSSEEEAACAYNKAVDTLHRNGFRKGYLTNYLPNMSKENYLELYNRVTISKKLEKLMPDFQMPNQS